MNGLPNMSLSQVYPEITGNTNLNCCGDPDCGNYGVAPDTLRHSFVGPGSSQRRLAAAISNPQISAGVGRYRLASEAREELHRETDAFEFDGDPIGWTDGRTLICQHMQGNGDCGVSFSLLSNQHFEDELTRLIGMNGVLKGPRCGACGTGYLDSPEEFIFNGANGKPGIKQGKAGREPRAIGMKAGSVARAKSVRVIHVPCRGKPGARFTVSSEHRRQINRAENIQILALLANGAGTHDIRRILRTPRGEAEPGMSRLYDRIFWLERTLLAYEKAQLSEWRKRVERQRIKDGKPYVHTRIAHDDISIGVNWETRSDRRITQLNCAVSADIRSGYVFRCDVDFDPTVDPVRTIEDAYCSTESDTNLRKTYHQSQKSFTAPLLAFQRPTGRFDEPALFAAAEARLRLFVGRTSAAFIAKKAPLSPEAREAVDDALLRADRIEFIKEHWFNLVGQERDSRNSFDGIMTRDTYTKAASLSALKAMLPSGKITLVGEQEAAMARVVPHIFRQEILKDRFEWVVVGFNKEASIDMIEARRADFLKSLDAWRKAHPGTSDWEALHGWASANILPAYLSGTNGAPEPWPIANFSSAAFPRLWLRSPIQAASEIDKTVGFPILSPRYRNAYRRLGIDEQIDDPELRAAITRRVVMATLQPASTFMNAIRERLSIVQRSGGRSTRNGPSFINGAAYSPRVLIALLNIWRIHYNFFDWRTYNPPVAPEGVLESPSNTDQSDPELMRSLAVPGTDQRILIPVRRSVDKQRSTPAMHLKVLQPSRPSPAKADDAPKKDRRSDDRPYLPNLSRILYQPWLFYGTPMWAKLQGR